MASDWSSLNDENTAIWQTNAGFWDERMGEGNAFFHKLIAPSAGALLALKPDEHVLEIACGNGNFSRWMAQQGTKVFATDVSDVFIERARTRTTELSGSITYQTLDATDYDALIALGEGRFDAAVCNMAIMDIPSITSLVQALPRLLKPRGRFVFTIMHPCFNSVGLVKGVEEDDKDGVLTVRHFVKIEKYATPISEKGLGMIGQPVPQFYFHRPLNQLFSIFFDVGFAITGLLEPTLDGGAQRDASTSWANYTEIPPVLAARLVLL
jgi:SAM-dependent methyltransferase